MYNYYICINCLIAISCHSIIAIMYIIADMIYC
jgi:hypothetical protein